MAKGGNPNWEYQLVSQEGHYSDRGLRQRALVLGILPQQQALRKENFKRKKKAKKPSRTFDLAAIFKVEKTK